MNGERGVYIQLVPLLACVGEGRLTKVSRVRGNKVTEYVNL